MKFVLFTFFFLFTSTASAAENQAGSWLGTFAKEKLTPNFSAWMETQVRYALDEGGTEQVLYRAGLLQALSVETELGYLYGYIQSNLFKEHRFTLQHTTPYGKAKGFNAAHRMRLEYRRPEDGLEASWRYRYLFRAESEAKGDSSLVVWDELFFNLDRTDWNGKNSLDRNRFFIGWGEQYSNAKSEIGYLNQFVPRDSGDVIEHILVFYFFI